ncbi:MAG: haloacid dehalogenase-like hydrolase [Butyrivibrio sp.]|nr:haloacid dehalogenase-like hydrolase [Butyrivibrio sp.]
MELKENNIDKTKRPIRLAICYDFDKTLSPDDMQSFTLIPSLGMDNDQFWKRSNTLAKANLMDTNLAWMYELISLSKVERQPIRKEYFNEIGKEVPLYNGVKEWFDKVKEYGASKGVEIEHYIISSGLKEIIEGSAVADKVKRIYASSYLYSVDGIAEWPAQAINYTTKTQYLFRIAKGTFEEYDERVNDIMAEEDLYIPYSNFVYIGDSATDIPCMRLVKRNGGYSIGVYDPDSKETQKVKQLYEDGRLSFYTAADYREDSELMQYMKKVIDEVARK